MDPRNAVAVTVIPSTLTVSRYTPNWMWGGIRD